MIDNNISDCSSAWQLILENLLTVCLNSLGKPEKSWESICKLGLPGRVKYWVMGLIARLGLTYAMNEFLSIDILIGNWKHFQVYTIYGQTNKQAQLVTDTLLLHPVVQPQNTAKVQPCDTNPAAALFEGNVWWVPTFETLRALAVDLQQSILCHLERRCSLNISPPNFTIWFQPSVPFIDSDATDIITHC